MINTYAHRPISYRAANIIGSLAEHIGLEPRIHDQYLLDKAQRLTKLNDFGDDSFVTGFELLIQSLREEAKLNTIGKLSATTYLTQLLCNRLRLEKQYKSAEKIGQRKISRPIFITGLPRSGTTFLHALLAEDPNTRTPITWEVMYPAPLDTNPSSTSDSKKERSKRCANDLKWLDRLAPKFNSIHAVKAQLPQECIAITTHDFASIQFHTTYNVPSYQQWLEQRNMVSSYRYHKRFLQHLQNHDGEQQWLLKAPGHLYDLSDLMKVYPDAQIIQTHRDPVNVIASISSHANVIRAAFSDELDHREIAQDWQRYWKQALSRNLDYRQQNQNQTINDVYYGDLVSDPIGVVKNLYENLNLNYNEEFESALKKYIDRNPQSRHKYTLQEFGFNKRTIQSAFADYYQLHQGLADI